MRIAWARRYAPMFGADAQELLAFEEARRFRALEDRSLAFARAYTDFLAASSAASSAKAIESGLAAAPLAAAMGLTGDRGGARTPLAAIILDEVRRRGGAVPAEVEAEVAAAMSERRLRLL
jgi:hypothetical protein